MNIDPDAVAASDHAAHAGDHAGPLRRAAVRHGRALALAGEHELAVIEDCAHAIETEYHGRKAGTFGDFGCFSFYVTKNVVTGEGGMVARPADEELAARIKMLALHGMSKDAWKRFSDEGYKHYQVVEAGFKYNMMDLQAALGIHQLERVEQNWQRRQEIWRRYDEALRRPAHRRCRRLPSRTRATRYHLYTMLVDDDACGISARRSSSTRMTGATSASACTT